MNIGDFVVITQSPYSSVPNGTVTKITDIRQSHFGFGIHLYILGALPHKGFRRHEIREARAADLERGEDTPA